MHIASAIVNSRVFCLGTVDPATRESSWAAKSSPPTAYAAAARQPGLPVHRLHVGTDFTVQQKLDQANEKMRLLSGRVRQIDHAAAAHPGPEANKAREEFAKMTAELRDRIGDYLGQLDADDGATVEARGEIFPASSSRYCRVSIVVEEKLRVRWTRRPGASLSADDAAQ